jgi:hypothetical protein
LLEQFLAQNMEFVADLTAEHMAKLDEIIKATPYVPPVLKEFILPG